jgi:hypothetical protein
MVVYAELIIIIIELQFLKFDISKNLTDEYNVPISELP